MADENLEGVEIISGEYQTTKEREEETGWAHTPKIYKNKKMSGVYKRPGDLKSHRLVDKSGMDLEERQLIQFNIEYSRKYAKMMTKKLIDWYESQKQNEK